MNLADVIFIAPIGVIGIWRWSIWLIKKVVSSFYRPKSNPYKNTVSIITPVYNETPEVFTLALNSWVKNKPSEIIAVIDYTDYKCIDVFKNFSAQFKKSVLIITKTPGKREALADGIRKAKGKIVALVDCDTIWDEDVLKNGLCPFNDPTVGGVATNQAVLKPLTLAQRAFAILLDLRYNDDMPFLSVSGPYLRCLSGRTAFYRREAVLPLLDDLVSETFFGQKVISGDDKRLTYTLQNAGWHTYYQSTSRVYTPGMKNFSNFIKQKIRWTRNSWREDLYAFFKLKFVQKNPIFLIGFIDSAIQPFTLLLSPLFFIAALYLKSWTSAGIIAAWWLFSRTIKLWPHLKKSPTDIVLVPLYVPFSFFSAIIKIYALISLNTQGWITRWDAHRLQKFSFFSNLSQIFLTTCLISFVSTPVILRTAAYKQDLLREPASSDLVLESQLQNVSEVKEYAPIATRHVVTKGETLTTIAEKYATSPEDIVKYNFNILPNWNRIDVGTTLTIPLKDNAFTPLRIFNFESYRFPYTQVTYSELSNSLAVAGRGSSLTLKRLAELDGYTHIKEVDPKTWLITSNIMIGNGVSLDINLSEASWIKLKSDAEGYVKLETNNGRLTMDGIKITSWDEVNGTIDSDYSDGRAYILAKGNGRFDIYNSELSYLGYKAKDISEGGTYGVSWRIPSRSFGSNFMTGEIRSE